MASLLFAVFIAAFHGVGVRVVGNAFPRGSTADIFLYHALTISLGAFVLSVWVFVWGLMGLSSWVVISFIGLGLAACWIDKSRHGATEFRSLTAFVRGADTGTALGLAVLAALLVLTFFAAQAPETGNDSMAYHLYFPKLHVLAGRLVHDEFHTRSLWPAMMGMLFTAGLLLQGVALAKLFAWMTLVLAIAAAGAFARVQFSPAAARWTLLFLVAIPALWQQSLYAYTDLAILLFTLLSFITLWRWEESGFLPGCGVIAGLCLGALLSIKFSALVSVLFFLSIFGVRIVRAASPGLRAKITAAAVVLGTSAAACGFWYVRSWMLTGNPVFPFMADVFGSGFSQKMIGWSLIPKTPVNFLLLPWNLTMRVGVFGGEPLGVLFLAGLPFLVFFPRRNSAAAAIALLFLFYATAWYLAIQHIRFLLPGFPFLCLVLGVSVAEWRKGRSKFSGAIILTLVSATILQCIIVGSFTIKPFGGAFGRPTAKQYLRQNERSFEFMESVNEALAPGDGVLIVGEPRLFYAPRGAVFMTPIIAGECQTRKISLRQWLDEHQIYHIVTVGAADFEKPPVPVKLVISKVAHDASRPVYYALWRRSG